MNQDRESKKSIFSKIRKWPIEKKRVFSISMALFLTILIIILNSGLNLIWKDETKNTNVYNKNNPINTIQKSFSDILNEAKPALDQIFGSSTEDISASSAPIEKTVDQINSTSSSITR